ncbi:hypothetical protein QCD79_24280, partial [Pseudomonas quasicaspiana]|nr:hypothetical protein [Pseudomonas quasicaspiana]
PAIDADSAVLAGVVDFHYSVAKRRVVSFSHATYALSEMADNKFILFSALTLPRRCGIGFIRED